MSNLCQPAGWCIFFERGELLFAKAELTVMQKYPLHVKVGRTHARIMEFHRELRALERLNDAFFLFEVILRKAVAVHMDMQPACFSDMAFIVQL